MTTTTLLSVALCVAGSQAFAQTTRTNPAKVESQAQVTAIESGDSFPNDPTAQTWLPATAMAVSSVPEVDAFLKSLHGRLRLLACWYGGPKLAASRAFVSSELITSSTKWTCAARTQPVAGDKDALDVSVTFRLSEGVAAERVVTRPRKVTLKNYWTGESLGQHEGEYRVPALTPHTALLLEATPAQN